MNLIAHCWNAKSLAETAAIYQAFQVEEAIRQALKEGSLEEVELPLEHNFAGGFYIRTIYMPTGACVVGEIHKFEHYACMHYGDISIYELGKVHRWAGEKHILSRPGAKRVLYIHEDTKFSTIHVGIDDPGHRDDDKLKALVATNDLTEYLRLSLCQLQQ